MNLHDKTPQQLNIMVAEIKFPDCVICPSRHCSLIGVFGKPKDGGLLPTNSNSYDWINDDALAFRFMVDNKISLFFCEVEKLWFTTFDLDATRGNLHYTDNGGNINPRRAIVECFILMNQNKEA